MRILLKNVAFAVIGILVVTQGFQEGLAQSDSLSTVVQLQEKDVTVTVYYHSGDEEWAQHIFDTTVEALPILERLAGFSYPHVFDVEVYPKSDKEIKSFGGQNHMGKGIWINRDVYTPGLIQSLTGTGMIIHENAHYWSNNSIYGKPWLKEGFCELFTYLTFKEMGREMDALSKKNEWSSTFSRYSYYDLPLDTFEYQESGPSNATTTLAYSKSALFCYEIYTRYGLDEIQQINTYLHKNSIAADSFLYVNLLEEYTGEDQKEFFTEWVFPDVDVKEWQHAEDALNELEELIDSSLSIMEDTYGFDRIMDFIDFQVHTTTQLRTIKLYMNEYSFERAAQIAEEEIEEIKEDMAAFDGYASQYFEAEEYYISLQVLGEIPDDKLLAAKESLLSFEYTLFSEQLKEFLKEMEMFKTYDALYNAWCGEGCSSFYTTELLFKKDYEAAIKTVDTVVTAFYDYTATEKALADKDLFTTVGIVLLGKRGDFESDLEYAQEEIKNGDVENAYSALALIREELSKARNVGIGAVFAVLVLCALFLVRWRKIK